MQRQLKLSKMKVVGDESKRKGEKNLKRILDGRADR